MLIMKRGLLYIVYIFLVTACTPFPAINKHPPGAYTATTHVHSPTLQSPTPAQTKSSPTISITPTKFTTTPTVTPPSAFSFAITSDMTGRVGPGEFDKPVYFRGACESIARTSNTAFMVSVGDVSPPGDTFWTVKQYLGEDYLWFPVVGNHDVRPPAIDWLRGYLQ